MDITWFLVIVGGTVALGAAIAYGYLRSRQRTLRERVETARATHEIYNKEDRAPGV